MRAPTASLSSTRRGSVIVIVLVMVMLASLMLVKFMETSAVEMTLATRQADRANLRADAYAALETLLAVMAEVKAIDEDRINAPEQGWGDPYAYAGESPREGVTVSYAFTDESGKASLPKLSFDDLVELAQALGLSEPDARRFSDGLFAWMREDYMVQDIDATPSRYEAEDPPITVPKRSLRSWGELRAIRVARDYLFDPETGAPTAFALAFQQNVSLYDFEGTNVNALAPALGVIRGWDPRQIEQVNAYRGGGVPRPAGAPPWFRGPDDLRPVLGANADVEGLDAEVKVLRVEITVKEGASSMVLAALIAVDESAALPDAALPSGSATPGANAGAQAGAGSGAAQGAGGRQAGGNNGQGGAAAGGAAAAGGTATAEERLNYPFTLLEVVETNAPPPVVSPEEEVDPATTL